MEANSERWHQAAAERKYHSSSRERVGSMRGRCVRTAGAFCSLLQTNSEEFSYVRNFSSTPPTFNFNQMDLISLQFKLVP